MATTTKSSTSVKASVDRRMGMIALARAGRDSVDREPEPTGLLGVGVVVEHVRHLDVPDAAVHERMEAAVKVAAEPALDGGAGEPQRIDPGVRGQAIGEE